MTMHHMHQTQGGQSIVLREFTYDYFRDILPFYTELPGKKHIFLVLEGQADLDFVYSNSKWHINSEVAFGHLTAASSCYVVLKLFLVCKPHLSFLYHRNKVFIN